ncbi:MAG: hypothetical protein KF786_12135 [Burkholderiaceae bacterium]|jgi:hypothetical protein|nr:hypothetical protein [Burkholderiaceae bacterium]HMN63941.1 hypothetical protein [Burkholderiaceae bacterium]
MISASLPPINDFPKAFGYLTAPMMAIKPRSRGARFNAPMNPVLHAVSRLLDSAPGSAGALSAAELTDSLSRETRLRMATRLALVDLAARCERPTPSDAVPPAPCTLCMPLLARLLERLAGMSDEQALAGLVELAPQLRELADTLQAQAHPLAVLPRALLELLRARLH